MPVMDGNFNDSRMTPNEQLLKEWAMEGGHLNQMKHMSQWNAINTIKSAIGLVEWNKHLMNMPRPSYPKGGEAIAACNGTLPQIIQGGCSLPKIISIFG